MIGHAYPVPCKIAATVNDHLMLVDITIADTHATRFVTGLRALLDAKLHCLNLTDPYRDLPITAEGEELWMDFGQHQTARVTPSQLEELEYFAIDWILELCKPNLRYSLRLQGRQAISISTSPSASRRFNYKSYFLFFILLNSIISMELSHDVRKTRGAGRPL